MRNYNGKENEKEIIYMYAVVCHFVVNCNLPGSSVHGTSQVRILGWVAIPFSRGSSQPRDQTRVSSISSIDRHILCHQHRHISSFLFIHLLMGT